VTDPSSSPPAGGDREPPDETVRDRARTGIRAWVTQSGRMLMMMTPSAIVTAMTAAAVAPVLLPLLGATAGVVGIATGTLAVQALLAQLGGLGGNYLADVLHDVTKRMRGEARVAGRRRCAPWWGGGWMRSWPARGPPACAPRSPCCCGP
jgi:hypothetical protein